VDKNFVVTSAQGLLQIDTSTETQVTDGNGKVFDVTSFLESHPGGANIMYATYVRTHNTQHTHHHPSLNAPLDATEDFALVEHSDGARQDLAKLVIGKLAAAKPE
jgi:cytochrome b involved in lipid metabolism